MAYMEGAEADTGAGVGKLLRVIALVCALGALMAAVGTSSANAVEFGLVPDSFSATARDDSRNDLTQAGAHPNASTSFTLTETTDAQGFPTPVEDLKDVRVWLPTGLVGDPNALPRCDQSLFNGQSGAICPPETQVGIVMLRIGLYPGSGVFDYPLPVYNLVPPAKRPAQFGFRLFRNNVVIDIDVRTGSDYGITATIKDVPGGVETYGATLTLWGVPSADSHNAERFLPGGQVPGDENGLPFGVSTPRKGFMISPTLCAGPPTTRIAVRSWQNPDRWVTDETQSPAVTGCDVLRFEPSVSLKPRLPRAGAPSGYDVALAFNQPENPTGLAASALRDAVVTLPPGTVVNPSSAQGLEACSPEQFSIGDASGPTCPGGSKIGTVRISTPLLADEMTGSIYLQRQTPTQLLALYLFAEGSGVTVKLAGTVDPDPVTGQLKATFLNNPQLPVRSISLSFKDGPRSPLSNPRVCGPATTTTALSPWSGRPAATPTDSFVISGDGHGAPCPSRQFAPEFVSGTRNPVAGAYSPLTVRFGRSDADEYLSRLTLRLPKGQLARIAAATLCNDAQANAGTCGEDSRIGSVTTAAGAGSNPLQLPGRVYVTGPYKGAPFGLSIVVPAIAGPFDLGTVVVRASIAVDRQTAELTIASDPLPTILKGIPLQVRLVEVRVDRDRFTVNPTNCTPTRLDGQLASTTGSLASVSSRYQVASCGALPFTPKMTLKVGSRKHTRAESTTPLTVTLAMRPGQANNRRVQVTLPKTLNARLNVVSNRNACTMEQFRTNRCPLRVGTGTAVTPLLRDPLTGPVYLVKNPSRRLPDLMVSLHGQVDFDLTGKVTVLRDLTIRTDFDTVPDVPITKFSLRLVAGRNAPLGVVNNLCSAKNARRTIARLRFDAQSGKRVTRNQRMQIAGCGRAANRRAASRAGRSKRADSKVNAKGKK